MDDKDEFNEDDQCDPLELLSCLLEYIEQDVRRLHQCTGNSAIKSLLELFSVRRQEVGANGQVDQIDEACLYANLPLHDNCSLEEAIQNYLRPSHAKVIRWPAVLIVAIDRVAENGGGAINNSRVTFSEDLRLGPSYKLRGTICHSGQNSSTGHYTAVAKRVSRDSIDLPSHPELSDLTSKWTLFDDSRCCSVDNGYVFSEQCQRTTRLLLFEADFPHPTRTLLATLEGLKNFYEDNVVYPDEDLSSMNLSSLSLDELQLQLVSRRLPTVPFDNAPIDSLVN